MILCGGGGACCVFVYVFVCECVLASMCIHVRACTCRVCLHVFILDVSSDSVYPLGELH